MNSGLHISEKIYKEKQILKDMKTKRGVSGVVVMILLVLLALAAIAIIWGFVQSYLRTTTGGISEAAACLEADLVPVSCEIDGANANVVYKLNSGEVSGVKVILELDDGTSFVEDADSVPSELESKSHTIEDIDGTAESATIAAVVSVNGEESTCESYLNSVSCV